MTWEVSPHYGWVNDYGDGYMAHVQRSFDRYGAYTVTLWNSKTFRVAATQTHKLCDDVVGEDAAKEWCDRTHALLVADAPRCAERVWHDWPRPLGHCERIWSYCIAPLREDVELWFYREAREALDHEEALEAKLGHLTTAGDDARDLVNARWAEVPPDDRERWHAMKDEAEEAAAKCRLVCVRG